MKRNSILALLVALALAACRGDPAPLGLDAPVENVPNIVGEYALNATNGTGGEYGGTLIIAAGEEPDQYIITWLVSGDIQEGIGSLEGNQLTFTWKSMQGTQQNLSGYGSYTITVNGELYGLRYIDGVSEPGQEAAYPNPK